MVTPEPTVLGKWLRYCRGDRPQAEVAQLIGMDQAEWSKWETGRRKEAKADQVRAFARAVGAPVASMALAYAGIWPLDADEDVSDPEERAISRRLRLLDLPPNVTDGELLMLKHLFRGLRSYEAEAEADGAPDVGPSVRERLRARA